MSPNDLTNFLGISKKTTKETKKKSQEKAHPIEDEKIEFMDDPIEIQPMLGEVAERNTKTALLALAKEYQLSNLSQSTFEELQDALYSAIRSGAKKKIGYLKEIGYIKWIYKCKCGYQKIVNTRKNLMEQNKVSPEICPKCGKPFALKQV